MKKKLKRHDLQLETIWRTKDKWNEDRMKRLDFMNKRIREKNEARAYITNADEALLEYYWVFAKQIKHIPAKPRLSDFHHPSGAQKHGELLFVIATNAVYKYLKK